MTKTKSENKEIILKDNAFAELRASSVCDENLAKEVNKKIVECDENLVKEVDKKIVECDENLVKEVDKKIVECDENLAKEVDNDNKKSCNCVVATKGKKIFNIIKNDIIAETKNIKKPATLFILALTFAILFFSMAIFNSNSAYNNIIAKQKYVYQNSLMKDGAYVGLDFEETLPPEFETYKLNFVKRNERLSNMDNKFLIELDVIYFDKTLPEGKIKISAAIAERLQEKNAEIKKEDKKNQVKVPSKLFEDKIEVGEKFKVFDEVFEVAEVVKTNYANDKKYNKLNTYEYDFIYLPQSYFEKFAFSKNVILQLIDGEKTHAVEVVKDETISDSKILVSNNVFRFFEGKESVLFDRGARGNFAIENKTYEAKNSEENKIWVNEKDYLYLKKVASDSFLAIDAKLKKSQIKELSENGSGVTLDSKAYKKYSEYQDISPRIKEAGLLQIFGAIGCIISLALASYFGYKLCKKYFEIKKPHFDKLDIVDNNIDNNNRISSTQLAWYEGLVLAIAILVFSFINFVVLWLAACYLYGIIVFANAKILMILPMVFGFAVAFIIMSCCFANSIKENKNKKSTQICEEEKVLKQ